MNCLRTWILYEGAGVFIRNSRRQAIAGEA